MRRLIVVIGCVIGSAAMANVGVFSGSGQTPVAVSEDDKGVVRATCSSGLKGHATYK